MRKVDRGKSKNREAFFVSFPTFRNEGIDLTTLHSQLLRLLGDSANEHLTPDVEGPLDRLEEGTNLVGKPMPLQRFNILISTLLQRAGLPHDETERTSYALRQFGPSVSESLECSETDKNCLETGLTALAGLGPNRCAFTIQCHAACFCCEAEACTLLDGVVRMQA